MAGITMHKTGDRRFPTCVPALPSAHFPPASRLVLLLDTTCYDPFYDFYDTGLHPSILLLLDDLYDQPVVVLSVVCSAINRLVVKVIE